MSLKHMFLTLLVVKYRKGRSQTFERITPAGTVARRAKPQSPHANTANRRSHRTDRPLVSLTFQYHDGPFVSIYENRASSPGGGE